MTSTRHLLLAAALVAGTLSTPAKAAVDCGDPRADPPPVDVVNCYGTSPGTQMSVTTTDRDVQDRCPMGFFFAGSDGDTYATMPASCHLQVASAKPVLYARRRGPAITGPGDRRIGEVVFAHWTTDMDFGLVRLFRGVTMTPQQCYWGGPTRMDDAVTSGPELVRGRSYETVHQVLLAQGRNGPHRITTTVTEPLWPTGTLVTDVDGRLIGHTITEIPFNEAEVVLTSVERPGRGIALAEKSMRIKLRLMTAPVIE